MVLPLIAGGAILAFITWGEDVLIKLFGKSSGKTSFNKMIKGGIVLGIVIIIYIVYKTYQAWVSAKEAAEDTVEGVTKKFEEGWDWILEGTDTGKDDISDLLDELPEIPSRKKAIEMIDVDLRWDTEDPMGIFEVFGQARQDRLKEQFKKDISKIAKAKADLLNAPSYYAEKLKFW